MGNQSPPSTPKLALYKGRLNLGGVKFFMDGALGSYGAALVEA